MQSGRLMLTGIIVSVCLGMVSGCSSTTAKSAKSEKPKPKKEEVVTEYIIKHAPRPSPKPVARALPLPRPETQQQSAQKRRAASLKQKRQQEWEKQQQQKRIQYQQQWEQQQAQKQAQAKTTALARQQQDAKRKQYQQQWEQQQAKRRQYQQKWEQQQAKNRQRQQQYAQSSQRQQQQVRRQQQVSYQQPNRQRTKGYGGRGTKNYYATRLTGDFAGNRKLNSFIKAMAVKHGFSETYLYGIFSKTRNRDVVARLWAGNNGGSSSGGRGWYNYRSKFVTPGNTAKGAKFWQQYRPHIMRASQRYKIDPEYIVGIMGVETRWGRILGKHRVIDALTTSAVVNKRRSKFFFSELENYLLMTRSERMDPLEPKGSYAGAMGYGQFMPSSFRAFAVDFDGDGIRDLWNPVDAIGSIANYFAKHGWKYGQDVAVPAHVTNMAYTRMPDGYKVKYSASRLAKKGIRPRSGRWSKTGRTHLLALTTVPGGLKEPWIGYHNFYVITRYNHSNYYAMAVHQLAKEVKRRVESGKYASR